MTTPYYQLYNAKDDKYKYSAVWEMEENRIHTLYKRAVQMFRKNRRCFLAAKRMLESFIKKIKWDILHVDNGSQWLASRNLKAQRSESGPKPTWAGLKLICWGLLFESPSSTGAWARHLAYTAPSSLHLISINMDTCCIFICFTLQHIVQNY